MEKYKLIHGYASEELEAEINHAAADGFVISHVLQQSENGTYICVIMKKSGK